MNSDLRVSNQLGDTPDGDVLIINSRNDGASNQEIENANCFSAMSAKSKGSLMTIIVSLLITVMFILWIIFAPTGSLSESYSVINFTDHIVDVIRLA